MSRRQQVRQLYPTGSGGPVNRRIRRTFSPTVPPPVLTIPPPVSNTGFLMARTEKYLDYVKPHLARIEHLCRMGATEEEICRKLGVSHAGFNNYKHKYPELLEAIKKGRTDADDTVEAALYHRAIGCVCREERSGDDGCTSILKEYPPDVTAAIFWLKNRRPERWRDRHEIGVDGGAPVRLIEEEKNL